MQTEIISDKDGNWAFKEKFNVYEHNNRGYCEVLVGFDGEGFVEPNLYIDNRIIPMTKRLEEKHCKTPTDNKNMIHSYINAKDPFYSQLGECLLLNLRVYMDYGNIDNKEINAPYFPNKTTYTLYTPRGYDNYTDEETGEEKYYLVWDKVENVPTHIKVAVDRMAERLASLRNSRYGYIYYRTWRSGVNGSK